MPQHSDMKHSLRIHLGLLGARDTPRRRSWGLPSCASPRSPDLFKSDRSDPVGSAARRDTPSYRASSPVFTSIQPGALSFTPASPTMSRSLSFRLISRRRGVGRPRSTIARTQMRADTAIRLMESIAAGRLTVLCGAGLSMAPPSSIPSAAAVATHCAGQYRNCVGTPLDPSLVSDVERMSKWFFDNNRFEPLFIERLVPWSTFHTSPNSGHAAIADFLACGIVQMGVTTNYDRLVESAAQELGEPDFLAITGIGDLARSGAHNPYLKVHGCVTLAETRRRTIWFREQLDQPSLKAQMDAFRLWLQTHLLGRDILIVGFWSDWAYLSEIFAHTVRATGPNSVYLVDPSPEATLRTKAPDLWDWVHSPGIAFYHEQESGADFLESLRQHFSRVFLGTLITDAANSYSQLFGSAPTAVATDFSGLDARQLYSLRRDLTGVPRNRPVRHRESRVEHHLHAAIHARLLDRGAIYNQHTYAYNGETIRLISGAGQLLSDVKRRFEKEPPFPRPIDRVVCIGALPDPTPPSVIRGTPAASILRPGGTADWVTHEQLLSTL